MEPTGSAGRIRQAGVFFVLITLGGATLLSFTLPAPQHPASKPKPAELQLQTTFANLPSFFEENVGQNHDQRIDFIFRGPGYSVQLASNEVGLHFGSPSETRKFMDATNSNGIFSETSRDLTMKLKGAATELRLTGEDELPGKVNYLVADDPGKNLSNIPVYRKVRLHHAYPGTDVVYRGNDSNQFTFDFHLEPHADPSQIQLYFDAREDLAIDDKGNLLVGDFRVLPPLAYQQIGDRREPVSAEFILTEPDTVSFRLGSYHTDRPLVIDPSIIYSTFMGDIVSDALSKGVVDSDGNLYLVGGGVVAKLDPTGSSFFYITFAEMGASAIAVDATGNLIGIAHHVDLGVYRVVVDKLDPDGASFVYSIVLAGSGEDLAWGLAVDLAGNAYVTGSTRSPDFPILNALQPEISTLGIRDAFVTKIDPLGTIIYSTYLGGGNDDFSLSVAVDSAGSAFVSGGTCSTDFPLVNPVQDVLRCDNNTQLRDGFIAVLDPLGTSLTFSTFLGGSGLDDLSGIAVDSNGKIVVVGTTTSTDFPMVRPIQGAPGGAPGGGDMVISQIDPATPELLFSTYLGGAGGESPFGSVSLDPTGNVFIVGTTDSVDFPLVNSLQPAMLCRDVSGNTVCDRDAFVVKIDPDSSTLIFSSYLGGSWADYALSGALDPSGNLYVVGRTNSTDFPILNALQTKKQCDYPNPDDPSECWNLSDFDSFVTKINIPPSPILDRSSNSVDFGNVIISSDSTAHALTLTNVGEAPLSLSSFDVSGDFSQTNDCGVTLPAGASCTASITFSPTVKGLLAGGLSITDDAPGSPHSVDLTGVGQLPSPTLSAATLGFGSVRVDDVSAVQDIVLTNVGSDSLSFFNFGISSDFMQTATCGASLVAGSSCSISVSFTPTSAGVKNGILSVAHDGAGSPAVVALSGTGIRSLVSLSANSLDFGDQDMGTTSSSQPVTLTNVGDADLNVFSSTVSGEFSQTSDCATVLTPSSSCTIQVSFEPVTRGSRNGSVIISSDATNSPQNINLLGNGIGNPVPVLSAISPGSAPPGAPGFTLTVNGTDFVAGSIVRWDGQDRTTVFTSDTQLTADILAADIATAGTVLISVVSPTPGGGCPVICRSPSRGPR